MGEFWSVIQNKVLIPLAWLAALVLLGLLLRFSRMLWFRFKQAGFPPIVISTGDENGSQAFAAKLSEYLTEDAPGPAIIIPPGGGAVPPPVPVEQLYSREGWIGALTRIVLPQEPTFNVHVELLKDAQSVDELLKDAQSVDDSPQNLVTVRITRTPAGRVLKADSIQRKDETELIGAAGCLIIHSIRQEHRVMRHIPRWERWSSDIKGYATYRRALDYERNGNTDRALDMYNEAICHESWNFMVSIRKAALLEVDDEFKEAATVYRTCNELWPEHLETAYRLAASYALSHDHSSSERMLNNIRESIRPWTLWRQYGKTWLPTHWNVGERRYWRNLIRRRPLIFGSNKRRELYMTVRVAEQLNKMQSIVFFNGTPLNEEMGIKRLLTKMANLTTRRSLRSCYARLFHPYCGRGEGRSSHKHGWHNEDFDKDLVIRPAPASHRSKPVKPRRRIGWLSHYNAACFFSLALMIREDKLPRDYSLEDWKIDCARAAIRELSHVRRDPRSEIGPEWNRNDPALQPLKEYVSERWPRWSEFVGKPSSGSTRHVRTGQMAPDLGTSKPEPNAKRTPN